MRLRAAAIIHGRTKNVDFRAGLLVQPSGFTEQDVKRARKYITDSTRYFELAGPGGRRVVFTVGKYLITGISIKISELYKLSDREAKYTYVDNKRDNFGFIGLAIPIEDITAPFQFPYDILIDQYEKYMELRWEDSEEHPKEAYKPSLSDFEVIEVPALELTGAIDFSDLPAGKRCVLALDVDTPDNIAAVVTYNIKRTPWLSYCSDLPNTTSVRESEFAVVTAQNADGILNALLKEDSMKEKENAAQKDDREDNKSILKNLWNGKLSDKNNKGKERESEVKQDNSTDNKWKEFLRSLGLLVVSAGGILLVIREVFKQEK